MRRLLSLLLVLAATALGGCGNQGPLTLPTKQAPAAHPIAPASPTSAAQPPGSQR